MADYKLDGLTPVLENEKYALYKLGQVNDKGIFKGVRVEKATGKQVEVSLSMIPKPHVTALLANGYVQKIH